MNIFDKNKHYVFSKDNVPKKFKDDDWVKLCNGKNVKVNNLTNGEVMTSYGVACQVSPKWCDEL